MGETSLRQVLLDHHAMAADLDFGARGKGSGRSSWTRHDGYGSAVGHGLAVPRGGDGGWVAVRSHRDGVGRGGGRGSREETEPRGPSYRRKQQARNVVAKSRFEVKGGGRGGWSSWV